MSGFGKFIAAFVVALVTVAGSQGAGAQTLHGSLKGVRVLDPLIEQLDADNATCGIALDGLYAAIQAGVKDAGFKIGDSDYTLYLRVSTLPQRGDCFSSVDMKVYSYAKLVTPNYPKGNQAKLSLWDNGTILVSARNRHAGDVGDLVTGFLRDLAHDWKQDNS